jgi:glucose/arabinose dehydrogenase
MAWLRSFAPLAALAVVLATQVAAQCPGVTGRYQPKMGLGYNSSVFATGLKTPRGIVVDTAGNVLVVEQNGGSVRRIVVKDQGNIACVDTSKVLISDGSVSIPPPCLSEEWLMRFQTNHGIALSADGKTLFTSNLQSVTAYPYDAVAGTVGAGKVVVNGLGNNGPHPTRTILVSKSSPDMLMVARGSNANVDTATTDKASGRCMIKSFSIKSIMSTPATYTTGGEVLGWGLRNIVGMGEDPMYGGVVSFHKLFSH